MHFLQEKLMEESHEEIRQVSGLVKQLMLLSNISVDLVKNLDLVKFYLLTKKTKNFAKSRF